MVTQMAEQRNHWVGGMAEWTEGDTAYLSVAFTWKLPEARDRALWYKALGYRVRAGFLEDYAELGGDLPDAIVRHHPQATIASRGCPVGCWFCIVPAMEGRTFTLLPDFPVRPILCDNNLSALDECYQHHIIGRYLDTETPLLDANSGFEPRTFDRWVYRRWSVINRGPWRFAYDDMAEQPYVERVAKMLRARGVTPKRMRIYVLIGNEPVAECLGRIRQVIDWGGEPHCQPLMKLNAMTKEPWVRFDWTAQKLTAMARWANRRIWRYATFDEYRVGMKTARFWVPDEQERLFA
jgi:hypothetical protein